MRQAIVTKFIGPTNHRGSRIKASCEAKSIVVPWDDALHVNANHTEAARVLATLLGWHGAWFGGRLPSKEGNCYVCINYPSAAICRAVLKEDSFYIEESNRER